MKFYIKLELEKIRKLDFSPFEKLIRAMLSSKLLTPALTWNFLFLLANQKIPFASGNLLSRILELWWHK